MIKDHPTPYIRVEHHEKILTIILDRPDKRNAITVDMYQVMAGAIQQANEDDSIHVIFIRGSRTCFTAGNDLADFKAFNADDKPRRFNPLLQAISRAKKPIVAAVAGPAVGIGTTMLLHCDLVYAAENATFILPFVNLGLCPEGASSLLLPQLAGHQQAAELLMLGEPFSAKKAGDIGLVNGIYPVEELFERTLEQAKKLAAKPLASLCLTKKLLKQASADIVQETLKREQLHFAERLGSSEAREAFNAFFQKGKKD
jgi:enoyl-CoA hydratase/carnithine racemase